MTSAASGFRRSDSPRFRWQCLRWVRAYHSAARSWHPAARSLRLTRFWSCRRLISRRSSCFGRRANAATWAGAAYRVVPADTGRFFRVDACLRRYWHGSPLVSADASRERSGRLLSQRPFKIASRRCSQLKTTFSSKSRGTPPSTKSRWQRCLQAPRADGRAVPACLGADATELGPACRVAEIRRGERGTVCL